MPDGLRTPNLDELRTFCAAADLGSLGRAAIRLRVSQPALSKRVQALEALAGAELLRRTAQGVELTAAGRRLYEEAQRMLAQGAVIDELLAEIRDDIAPVRLAASHTVAESLLPTTLVGMMNGLMMSVELVIANSEVVRSLVADDRADVGLAAGAHGGEAGDPRLREEDLVEDEVVVAVPQDHPWARRQRITVETFLAEPMVVRDRTADSRATVAAVLAERGLDGAPPLVELGTTVAARTEARERHAPVLLSCRALTGHGLVRVEVDGLRFPRRFVVVSAKRTERSRASLEFVAALKRALAEHADPTPEARPGWSAPETGLPPL